MHDGDSERASKQKLEGGAAGAAAGLARAVRWAKTTWSAGWAGKAAAQPAPGQWRVRVGAVHGRAGLRASGHGTRRGQSDRVAAGCRRRGSAAVAK
eukprot:1690868-Pleurochrysis_carterae.AAC.3